MVLNLYSAILLLGKDPCGEAVPLSDCQTRIVCTYRRMDTQAQSDARRLRLEDAAAKSEVKSQKPKVTLGGRLFMRSV